jgi:hypothetical protein
MLVFNDLAVVVWGLHKLFLIDLALWKNLLDFSEVRRLVFVD